MSQPASTWAIKADLTTSLRGGEYDDEAEVLMTTDVPMNIGIARKIIAALYPNKTVETISFEFIP